MFSALRQGSSLYILNKSGSIPELKIGQIISATSPISNNYNLYLGNNTVDVQVKVNGETLEFKQLPSALSIATYDNGNTIVSESREIMCQEVENMLKTSRDILNSVPYHENVVDVGEDMLKQLSPQFAKQKDQEDKINNLESKVGGIEDKLDSITAMLSKALNK